MIKLQSRSGYQSKIDRDEGYHLRERFLNTLRLSGRSAVSRNCDSGDIENLADGFEHVQPEHPIVARSIVQIAMSTSIARLRHARESKNRDRLATLTM